MASGAEFFGRTVTERVGVLILAAEGQSNLPRRMEAAKRHRGVTERLPIAWLGDVPNLSDPKALAPLKDKIAAVAERFQDVFGVRLGVVFVDTVAASFSFKDENDNAEAANAIRVLRDIGTSANVLLVPVHHYGKSETTGLRGGSAFRAGADVVLSVLADRNEITGEVGNRALALSKTRDGEEGPIGPFDLKHIEIGTDDNGKPWGAAAISARPGEAIVTKAGGGGSRRQPPRNLTTFRDSVTEVLLGTTGTDVPRPGMSPVRAITLKDVRAEFYKRYATGDDDPKKAAETRKKAFNRALNALIGKEYATVEKNGEDLIWPL
jgi:hypothetical protein